MTTEATSPSNRCQCCDRETTKPLCPNCDGIYMREDAA